EALAAGVKDSLPTDWSFSIESSALGSKLGSNGPAVDFNRARVASIRSNKRAGNPGLRAPPGDEDAMRVIKTNPFSKTPDREPDRLAEIYREAARIICEKGYDATSMNDIAEAVGITKAGLYHHISGKRTLLFQIMSFGLDALEEEVIAPARGIRDAEQRLRAI